MRAYVATAGRLIAFLGEHLGTRVGERELQAIDSADLRAFLARRRADGLGAASTARELSGVRAFLRYAARSDGREANLPRTRAPKRPRTLPRPAAPTEALNLAADAQRAAKVPWIGARDLAVLLLLYGAGLRVAEALSLTGADYPLRASVRITGKRGKTRIVPIIEKVRDAIDNYVAQCPYQIKADAPCSAARGAVRSILTWSAGRSHRRVVGWAYPTA